MTDKMIVAQETNSMWCYRCGEMWPTTCLFCPRDGQQLEATVAACGEFVISVAPKLSWGSDGDLLKACFTPAQSTMVSALFRHVTLVIGVDADKAWIVRVEPRVIEADAGVPADANSE